jgi:hypothetical protein
MDIIPALAFKEALETWRGWWYKTEVRLLSLFISRMDINPNRINNNTIRI